LPGWTFTSGYFMLLHLWMASSAPASFALRYLSVVFSLLTVRSPSFG